MVGHTASGGFLRFLRLGRSGSLKASSAASSSKHHQREPLSLRVLFTRLIYALVVVVVAMYGSVSFEEVARRIANSQTNNVPKRAQVLINLLGTGQLDSQLPMQQQQQQQQLVSSAGDVHKDWRAEEVQEAIPIVFVTSHVPNEPHHPALVVIEQARSLNDLVYVVGPNPNLKHLAALGVTIEGRNEYNDTCAWLARKMGVTRIEVARPWILAAFMQRHNFSRVLSLSIDVMLYANVSQMVAWMYPSSKVVLPVRWPSMQPPPLPSQYTSTAVSNHAALWHIDALKDFLALYKQIWSMALFGGRPGSAHLMRKKEYSEMTILGWYTWSECWTNDKLDPPCMAEPVTGVSGKLAYRLRRTRFRPKFLVESLCQPRSCHNSTWSDEGLCVWDNNFSVATPSHFFRFAPTRGDKCPNSKLYEHFHAWMGQVPRKNVQFLAVNFQGSRRDYLKLEDPDPAKTWGSAVF
ncbi:hypothetical protein CLOM_g5923 [Closterium sp. NIES-68]|nr:hypothetical protein CLOM_g5923 [Closterium sp. NIES-68]GJP63259.1 hypothetical protein CLOP_g20318 [Closterium sp. NIES-67]